MTYTSTHNDLAQRTVVSYVGEINLFMIDLDGALKIIEAAEDLEGGSIPQEDVARKIATTLSEEKTYCRSFDLISGDTSITKALANI